jgi:hypothetical protein
LNSTWNNATACPSPTPNPDTAAASGSTIASATIAPHHAVEEVAHRQPPGGGVGASIALEQRIDGGPDIGAEHHVERRIERQHVAGGERDDEQHHSDARMRRPGRREADQEIEWRDCGNDREQQSQLVGVLGRLQHFQHLVERHQHQPQPDQNAAEIVHHRRRTAPEHQKADQNHDRGGQIDVEGEHADDQRGADIGAEHDRQRRHEIDEAAGGEPGRHQPRRRARLQQRRDADAGEERRKPMPQRPAQHGPQLHPECALHTGLHHMSAPEQQRDGAGQGRDGEGEFHSEAVILPGNGAA